MWDIVKTIVSHSLVGSVAVLIFACLISSGKDKEADELKEKAYNSGHINGYEQGYDEGYSDGYNEAVDKNRIHKRPFPGKRGKR